MSSTESVIVIGNAAREHAMARGIADSPNPPDVLYHWPGNVGIDGMDNPDGMRVQRLDIDPKNIDAVVAAARDIDQDSDLTVVVGPEAPLIAGAGNKFRREGIATFGPNAEAANLEGSKEFATHFMREFGIPHPETKIITSKEEAERYLQDRDPNDVVLKADRAEANRAEGVILPKDREEMMDAAYRMLTGNYPDGLPKTSFLVQERLEGPELSVFVVSDGNGGYSIVPYAAQDHKRLKDGDQGPNTGGMGAYSFLLEDFLTPEQYESVQQTVFDTIEGMRRRGIPFVGALYIGLILATKYNGQPRVVEFNSRFGDPETEVIMPSLTKAGVDVYDMFHGTARGHAPDLGIRAIGGSALTVMLATAGYPQDPTEGMLIHGLGEKTDDTYVYHGSTRRLPNGLIVAGKGRALAVTGTGPDIDAAYEAAYQHIGPNGIHFDDMQYRNDIAYQARRRR